MFLLDRARMEKEYDRLQQAYGASGEELAERSARLLLDMIEKHSPARHITVPFRLSKGESVKKYTEKQKA